MPSYNLIYCSDETGVKELVSDLTEAQRVIYDQNKVIKTSAESINDLESDLAESKQSIKILANQLLEAKKINNTKSKRIEVMEYELKSTNYTLDIKEKDLQDCVKSLETAYTDIEKLKKQLETVEKEGRKLSEQLNLTSKQTGSVDEMDFCDHWISDRMRESLKLGCQTEYFKNNFFHANNRIQSLSEDNSRWFQAYGMLKVENIELKKALAHPL